MRSVSVVIGTLGIVVLGASCSPSAEPTFEEFQALTFQEPDTGIFITNGDEPVETLDALRTVYERYLEEVRAADQLEDTRFAVSARPLIVNVVSGRDDRWSASQAQNLTFCVDRRSFGTNYNAVVAAINGAAGAWEATGSAFNFAHSSQYDASGCNSRNNNVVFNVRQVCRGQYLARAFFPSTSRRGREVLVDCTSFGAIQPWTLEGVLRHELGHTIGFRHEHTRPESGTCFEDNSWRALTAYDSSSVMHYPQCNGTQDGDLVLTSMDQAGALALYP